MILKRNIDSISIPYTMKLHEDLDIGIIDLELYNLQNRNNNDISHIHQFLTEIQNELEELIVSKRKRVIIFKGIEPYIQTNKKHFKSSINTFNKKNLIKEKERENKQILKLDFSSKNDLERDSNILYEKTLFIKLLESFKDSEIKNFQNSLAYVKESKVFTNDQCEIFNNKPWNDNEKKCASDTIIDDIELRLFFILNKFLSPLMKDNSDNNKGFMQLLKFQNKFNNKKIHNLIFPSFSDKATNNAPIEAFHCMSINDCTTKISCNEPLSNPDFLHSLRAASSSIPFLYPDVIPQSNHFVCFLNLNDLVFDHSVKNVYSQVGNYNNQECATDSSELFVHDLKYNLRVWEYFNDHKLFKNIFDFYTTSKVHTNVLNNFIMEKVCKFIQNMDSWILMKLLNGKIDTKKSIHVKIKEKDGFKFFAAKFLSFIDFKDKFFYNFTKDEYNFVEITLHGNHVSQFSNPDKKKFALTEKLNSYLQDDVKYMINVINSIYEETKSNSSGLTPVIKNLSVKTPDSKNKISKPLTPKSKMYKAEEQKKINAIKKNIFQVDILNHEELLDVVKENKKAADLALPTQEQQEQLTDFKLKQIKKVFTNYDCGSGMGVDVVMSHERLYGVLCDSNKFMNYLDLDEYESLIQILIDSKQLLEFKISKERFYRMK